MGDWLEAYKWLMRSKRRSFTISPEDIASRLNEAVIVARGADGFGKQGFTERAFQSLLELEPLMHEISTLITATSIVRRRDPSRTRPIV